MPRHNKRGILSNDAEYYEPLREQRGLKRMRHYSTPRMRNPTVAQRARLYTLADKYYSDSNFWWVIAWWNGYGVEADIKKGAVLSIPLDISSAIKILGV